ncbi:MAG: AbrB/MazE/SpoVT family DNA-binding domain-containing protein [Nanoarchaeota archaeon]|nr:AbrB/MazE/SpoVT family DNA-binding domain-containing protein [Nanoarchaeota archaeon]
MKKCSECNGIMKELVAKTPEGISYKYFKCDKCGEEIVDIKQLHNVAEKYRNIKKYHVRLSKWGLSLGLRIPKELTKKYNFREDKEVSIIPEEKDIKIVPS